MIPSKFNFPESQLKKKHKHALDFGVEGHYNAQTSLDFKTALIAHMENDGLKVIVGTYRGRSVIHYFNPSTSLNIVLTDEGNFLTGWKLNPCQVRSLINTGTLGGGS